MARATVLSSVLIATNGVEGPKWFQNTTAAILYIGYLCEYEDADQILPSEQSGLGGILCGIAGCPSYHDNTAAFAAGARVPVWMIGCGAEVWVTHDATGSVTVLHGTPITWSNTTDGLVEIDAARDIETIGTSTRTVTCSAAATNIRIILN